MTATRAEAPAIDVAAATEKPKSKKKLFVIIGVIAVLAAGYWMFLRPTPEVEPKPGEVMKLEEPVLINLASGSYLKLGLALQLQEGVTELDESKALDATIELFSGRNLAEVSEPKTREALKKQLGTQLADLYPDEVLGVYFTLYVTQ